MNKKQSNKMKLILKKSVLKNIKGGNNSGGNQGSKPQYVVLPPLFTLDLNKQKP